MTKNHHIAAKKRMAKIDPAVLSERMRTIATQRQANMSKTEKKLQAERLVKGRLAKMKKKNG